ncbi:MAG: CusA/CzcA family heavy metal efflux RND transporter [Bacteroidales bacterium]|jgi:cobalt-zinc-cadmium resistance protein CzcA
MLDKIINFSIRNKLIIILITLTIAGFGIYSIMVIPVGAVPDITNNQVQVITTSGNLSTQEIEQFITTPVELEMANLPGVKEIRSISKFGLSVVTIVFEERLGTYLPRQLIAEKIKSASANIPEGFGTPEMGPITTGLGEIYQYILDVKEGYEDRYSPMDLRTIQDWIVKRQLSGIPGVVEVNTWGGYLKQYEVAVDPVKMGSQDVTLLEVFNALESNNSISGGAYIEKGGESYFIRGDGLAKSLDDIGSVVIKNRNGYPVLIKDVATARYGHANRFGAITANGEGEKVLGQIMMLKNANSKKVINAVKEKVAEVQKSLPAGIYINPVLERSELISKTSFTVVENLLLGCFIVIFVVILILGNLRSALVIASMIPLALFFTISMMYIFGIDANLMSLGALDFGIIIDGAVIIVEYIAIRITANKQKYDLTPKGERQGEIDKITFMGASKMMGSAIFGIVIILIVFIPILSLSGVEGKMFRPMALTFSFALIGAMFLGLTWLPVASSLFLRPEIEKKRSVSKWIMNIIYKSYNPVIRWSYDHKRIVLGTSLASLILAGVIFSGMGGEFVPTLDEGDFVIQPVLKTGTSLSATIGLTTRMEKILKENFSEVDQIVSRIGAAEVPTDPMSMEEIDMIIKLKPKKKWKVAHSKEELAEKFKEALSVIPGIEYEFTQPIEMRFNELITGVRSDIAIKLFGEDLDYLASKANEIKNIISDVPGAADIILEKTTGLPQMNVRYNRDRIAYFGVDIGTLNNYLSMAFGGSATGSLFEGEKRFDLVVRLQGESRVDLESIKSLKIPLPSGKQISLEELADISYSQGPAKISRENTHRRVVVSVNVRNRDLQSVVKDIRTKLEEKISLQPGYYISYGGQFENLKSATDRLMFAVPLALALIFIFLHFAFKSFKDAIMIFSAVPLSAIGGIFALWIRGMSFSVSAGIGFIALFGVAVLNGIVLIEHLKELKHSGMSDIKDLIFKGTKERLRPVMLTAASAAMGFLPMAISTSAGAEVQRPLATVVIGGLITSTMLTMIALPLLYAILNDVTGIKLWPPSLRRGKSILMLFPLFLLANLQAVEAKGQVVLTDVLTLDKAIDLALLNNREYNAYKLKIEQNKALVSSAFAIEKTKIFRGNDQNNIAENGYPLNIMGIEQTFSFPSVYTSQFRVNKSSVTLAENELEQQRLILTMNVSKAYYRIVYLMNKEVLYRKLDSLYKSFVKDADIRHNLGDISNLERMNANASQQQVRLALNSVNYEIDMAYKRLSKLLHIDTQIMIPFEPLSELYPKEPVIEKDPGLLYKQMETKQQQELLLLERNKMLPDINLSFFNGTNRYQDAKNYSGYQVGISLPVFFAGDRARIRAGKIGVAISKNMEENYIKAINTKILELKSELKKHSEFMEYYHNTGCALSREIVKSAQRSYAVGDIDSYRLVQSIENAMTIETEYLDHLAQYNDIVLEINHLTM